MGSAVKNGVSVTFPSSVTRAPRKSYTDPVFPVEIIALDEQVPGRRVAVATDVLQQPIRHLIGTPHRLLTVQPVKGWHISRIRNVS